MNKIYKVVWSKAAEAYVVTSELAKSCTKSPSGKGLRRSVTAALLAAIAVAPVSFGVYAADDTHYVSVNSDNQTADSNYDNQGAQAKNSIAIGPSVKTTGEDNIIIGSGEIVSEDKKDGTSFDGTRVLVVGHGNYFQPTSEWDDNTKGKSISYRDVAIIGHSNKLLQGNKADAGKGYPTHQLVHGWKNTLNGSYTGAIGYENEIKNNSREGYTSHHMAFAIGSANTIDATGYYMGDKNRINTLADYTEPIHHDEAYGADLYVIGRHNIVGSNKDKESYVNKGRIIGSENVVYSNDVNVFGKFNKAYGSSALVVGTVNRVGVDKEGNLITTDEGGELTSPVAVGVNNVVTAPYGVAVGAEARAEGYRATAVGSLAVAPNDHSTAMGSENRATGYSSVAVGAYNNSYDFAANERKSYDSGMYSNAIGVMNISTAEASSAIGAKNTASGKQSSSFGYRNTAAGMNSSAVGYYNKAQGDKTSALGYFNQVTGKQSSAVGMQNYLTVAGSTAIGNYNNTWNVPEKKWEYQTAGAESAAIGIKNHSAGNYSSALGSQNKSGGTASSAVGYRNITDADLAAALGYANQATAGYGSAIGTRNVASGYQSSAVGNQNQAEGRNSQAVGYRNFVSGYGAVALGSENNLNFVKQYQALGFVQTGELSSALGISNTTAGRVSMGIGNSNYALGTKSVGVGLNNYSTGYETLAMGHYAIAGSEDLNKIDQVKYAAAIGNRAKSTITDAVAIGSFSNTTRDKGDYGYDPVLGKAVTDTDITDDANIGTYRTELENARAEWQTSMEKAEDLLHKIHTQKYANEAEHEQWKAEYDRLNADANAKMAAYDAAQKKVSDLVGAWQGQMAALSVGDEATGRTRQITGVAAGSADTDAVNVAQLKVLGGKVTTNADDIATLKEGWTLADAKTGKKVVKAKDTVKVTGDEYITATVNDDGLKLGMNETKLNTQINNQIDNSKTVQAKMTSWVLKAATTDKDPAAKGQTIDNDNKVVTFGVEKEDQGLTVARDGATIKYGIDGSKIDLAGNTSITNLNNKIEKSKIHYFSVNADDSKKPADTNWNNDGATGDKAIAIGQKAGATGTSDIAIGTEAQATGGWGVAIGQAAKAKASTAVAMAYGAEAQGANSLAIGILSKAKTNDSTAYGREAKALGEVALAVGMQAKAEGDHSAVFGAEAVADSTAWNGTAIGRGAYIGKQAADGTTPDTGVSNNYYTPVDDDTVVEAGKETKNSTAVGFGAKSFGYQNTALGAGAEAFDTNTVAVGVMSKAIGHYANALGKQARAEGTNSTAIGHFARALGESSMALGDYAITSTLDGTGKVNQSVALGSHARVAADNSLALGYNSLASIADDVKTEAYLSKEAFKKENGVVSVGNKAYTLGDETIAQNYRRITNVAGGADANDAVNVAQLKVVNDKADKNATDITNLTKTVNANGKATKVMVDGQEDRTDGNLKIKKTDTDGQLTYDLSLNDEIYLGKAGEDGKDGKDGKIGLTGKDGTSAEIRIGQGKPGVDGKDGETTTRIIYKDKGGKDHEVATLDDGLKFKGDNDTVVTRKLNEQLNITGGITDAKELSDNNIGVVGTQDGGMAVKLSKKLKGLTSAEFKDGDNITNITAGDVTVTKKEGNETKTLSIWELNKTVNNITAGTTDVSSWKLQANGKDERIIKKNSVVNFTNGTATEVTVHENNITVDLNKATKEKIDKIDNIDGRVTTIENNIKNIDQKIEGAKITVEGDTTTGVKAEEVKDKNDKVKGYKVSLDKQVKVGNVAIDGKDSKGEITGLTNTTVDATDFATKGRAATEEQLKAAMGKVQAQGRTTVKGSGNITVTPGTTGAAEYTVGLADNISVDSVTANEYKVGDKTYINKDGINANGNKITNVADGKVSADSKDAVNGSQLFGVEQKVNQNISILGGKVSELDGRVNRVGAGAAALAALHPLDFDPDDKWDFAAGYGNYSGANAVAIGAYYRPNEDTMFSVGGSFGGGENMVNAGVSVKLGQGNHVSTSRVAMAKDMLDMQQRMAEMEAQMAKLQGFIGALTGADAQAAMFPDVPENHWAYEYVDGLREQGIIEGYPDGNFAGDRSMTRYEIAAMLYRALSKGVSLDARAVKEFAPELARIRVDVVTKDKEGQPVIERVRVNEEQQAK